MPVRPGQFRIAPYSKAMVVRLVGGWDSSLRSEDVWKNRMLVRPVDVDVILNTGGGEKALGGCSGGGA